MRDAGGPPHPSSLPGAGGCYRGVVMLGCPVPLGGDGSEGEEGRHMTTHVHRHL